MTNKIKLSQEELSKLKALNQAVSKGSKGLWKLAEELYFSEKQNNQRVLQLNSIADDIFKYTFGIDDQALNQAHIDLNTPKGQNKQMELVNFYQGMLFDLVIRCGEKMNYPHNINNQNNQDNQNNQNNQNDALVFITKKLQKKLLHKHNHFDTLVKRSRVSDKHRRLLCIIKVSLRKAFTVTKKQFVALLNEVGDLNYAYFTNGELLQMIKDNKALMNMLIKLGWCFLMEKPLAKKRLNIYYYLRKHGQNFRKNRFVTNAKFNVADHTMQDNNHLERCYNRIIDDRLYSRIDEHRSENFVFDIRKIEIKQNKPEGNDNIVEVDANARDNQKEESVCVYQATFIHLGTYFVVSKIYKDSQDAMLTEEKINEMLNEMSDAVDMQDNIFHSIMRQVDNCKAHIYYLNKRRNRVNNDYLNNRRNRVNNANIANNIIIHYIGGDPIRDNLGIDNLIVDNHGADNNSMGNPSMSNLSIGNRSIGNRSMDDPIRDNLGIDNLIVENHSVDNHSVDNHSVDNHSVDNHSMGNLSLGNLSMGNLSMGNPSIDNLSIDNLSMGNLSMADLNMDNHSIDDNFTIAEDGDLRRNDMIVGSRREQLKSLRKQFHKIIHSFYYAIDKKIQSDVDNWIDDIANMEQQDNQDVLESLNGRLAELLAQYHEDNNFTLLFDRVFDFVKSPEDALRDYHIKYYPRDDAEEGPGGNDQNQGDDAEEQDDDGAGGLGGNDQNRGDDAEEQDDGSVISDIRARSDAGGSGGHGQNPVGGAKEQDYSDAGMLNFLNLEPPLQDSVEQELNNDAQNMFGSFAQDDSDAGMLNFFNLKHPLQDSVEQELNNDAQNMFGSFAQCLNWISAEGNDDDGDDEKESIHIWQQSFGGQLKTQEKKQKEEEDEKKEDKQ